MVDIRNIEARKVRPKIGLLPAGHLIYWSQFPGLKEMALNMYHEFRKLLKKVGDVIAPDLVDTLEKSQQAGRFFRDQDIDILFVIPLGYNTGMTMIPCVTLLREDLPIRILNVHADRSYDYKSADTTIYLYHEGPCCVPEYSAGLVSIGRKFKVITGPTSSDRVWKEITTDSMGAAAASAFKETNVGIIGDTYIGMVDVPTDEHRILHATGKLILRPEVEEIEEAFNAVTEKELKDMCAQFREMYDVDKTVTDEHMTFSAQAAIAYDKVIHKYDIGPFGYYWWGAKELITQLRSQSALAVSRLASMGRPGVTEGDLKTAMAMKIMDFLGAGGMFVEYFALDFDENFLLLGHDGPANFNVSEGRPVLQHLEVQHGKTGHGLGIDFDVKMGTATLLNMSQFDAGETFKLIYTVGEIVPGDILSIGNPNCRFKIAKPIPEFFNEWCQQGPVHHSSLGIGDISAEIEAFGEAMKFKVVGM